MQLSVFLENPFCVGVFERRDHRGYSVSRVVFGSDPRDREVFEFLLANLRQVRFSEPVADAPPELEGRKNPKRMQRDAREDMKKAPLSTKAQEALKRDFEQKKMVRKGTQKAEREVEKERRYEQKQLRAKQKKRGH